MPQRRTCQRRKNLLRRSSKAGPGRVFRSSGSEQGVAAAQQSESPLLSDKLLDAKVRLHRRLIEDINLSALDKVPEEEIRRHVQQLVSQYVLVERLPLNTQELSDFVSEILDEMTGLGPLEPLLKDPTINDILINGPKTVYVEQRPAWSGARSRFHDDRHLLQIVQRIVKSRQRWAVAWTKRARWSMLACLEDSG